MERRAAQAEATKQRIREAAITLYRERPEDFTLKAVASEAKTTVQTVLRLFGSKAALIVLANESKEATPRRAGPALDRISAAVRVLYEDYEKRGDAPAQPTEAERQLHRKWVEETFLRPAGTGTGPGDQALLFGLIVATDLSTWKLLRRELGLYRRAAEAVVVEMITALTGR
jgi:AcrR family transcriptional regulator